MREILRSKVNLLPFPLRPIEPLGKDRYGCTVARYVWPVSGLHSDSGFQTIQCEPGPGSVLRPELSD